MLIPMKDLFHYFIGEHHYISTTKENIIIIILITIAYNTHTHISHDRKIIATSEFLAQSSDPKSVYC